MFSSILQISLYKHHKHPKHIVFKVNAKSLAPEQDDILRQARLLGRFSIYFALNVEEGLVLFAKRLGI